MRETHTQTCYVVAHITHTLSTIALSQCCIHRLSCKLYIMPHMHKYNHSHMASLHTSTHKQTLLDAPTHPYTHIHTHKHTCTRTHRHTHVHTQRQTLFLSFPSLLPSFFHNHFFLSLFPFQQTADIQVDVSGCWPSSVQCSPAKIPCYSNTSGSFNLMHTHPPTYNHSLPLTPGTDAHMYTHKQPILPPLHP